jgi:hypothetical protein
MLTSDQFLSAIACAFPRLAHNGKALYAQIDLFLHFRTVWSRGIFSTMLPQSSGGQYDWKDEIARQSIKIVDILGEYRGSLLRRGYACSHRNVLGRQSLRRRPVVFSPVQVKRAME